VTRYVLTPERLSAVPWLISLPSEIEPYKLRQYPDGSVELTPATDRRMLLFLGGLFLVVGGAGLAIRRLIKSRDWRGGGTFGAALGAFMIYQSISRRRVFVNPVEGHITILRLTGEHTIGRKSLDSAVLSIQSSKGSSVQSSLKLAHAGRVILDVADTTFTETETRANQLLDFAVWLATQFHFRLVIEFPGNDATNIVKTLPVGQRLQPLVDASATE